MRLSKYILADVLVIVLAALVVNVSGQDARKAVTKSAPVYPEIAKRMSITGSVKIEVVIGADGEIKNTKVIGGHPLLVTSAVDALKKWKYEPAKTETTATLQFDFRP